MQPLLTVVVPAYNEAHRLPQTLPQMADYLAAQAYAVEFLVVDDGSTDDTAAAVERLADRYPFLRVIRNDHRGKGYTVRTGILAAAGTYVLLCDADHATPISEWEKLYHFLQNGADVAIGSREGLGAQRIGEPWYRHVMGRVFNGIVRAVALGGIQDTQCGFKAFTHASGQRLFEAVQLYGADAPLVQGAAVTAFDVEILFLARKWGLTIREAPVVWHYGEGTKVNPVRDTLRNFNDVLRVRWNDMRGKYDAELKSHDAKSAKKP